LDIRILKYSFFSIAEFGLKAGYGKKTNVFDNMTMQSLFENSIKKDLFRELL